MVDPVFIVGKLGNFNLVNCSELVFLLGKQPVNVEINVRDAVVSRPGFTFLATGK